LAVLQGGTGKTIDKERICGSLHFYLNFSHTRSYSKVASKLRPEFKAMDSFATIFMVRPVVPWGDD
jgi:hypothetical protein